MVARPRPDRMRQRGPHTVRVAAPGARGPKDDRRATVSESRNAEPILGAGVTHSEPASNSDPGSTGHGPAAPKRPGPAALVQYVFLVLVAGFGGYWIYAHRAELADAWASVQFWPVVGALVLGMVGAATAVPIWRSVLAGMGSVLGWRSAARIVLIGQLGKYVPGGVWPVIVQARMAREEHVPLVRSGSASLMSLLISVITSLTLGSGRAAAQRGGGAPLLVVGDVAGHPDAHRPAPGGDPLGRSDGQRRASPAHRTSPAHPGSCAGRRGVGVGRSGVAGPAVLPPTRHGQRELAGPAVGHRTVPTRHLGRDSGRVRGCRGRAA